jgi:predicted anti-sigma-YlaC factor YlaD
VICDRVRSQISLELDGELSQLERAMVAAHLQRCPDCRAYEAQVTAFTRVLRAAPLKEVEHPVVVRKPRRPIAARLQAGVAAAVAIVALGVTGRIALSESPDPSSPSVAPQQVGNPSMGDLQNELAYLEVVRPGKPLNQAHMGYVR